MSFQREQIRLKIQFNFNLSNNDFKKFWYFLDKNNIESIEHFKIDLLTKFETYINFNQNKISLNLKILLNDFEIPFFESTNILRDMDNLVIYLEESIKKRKLIEPELPQINKKTHFEQSDLDKNLASTPKTKPFEACIIGTSMVKHIDTNKVFENKKCFFKSISGGLIKDIFEFIKKREGFFNFCKYIVLTCGSNDCDSLNEIKNVVDNLIELAQYLKKLYPNSILIINELVPRLKTKYIDLELFEKRRLCFNNFLDNTLSALIDCKVIKHEKFENKSELEFLLSDGVHLSPLRGVPVYIEDIKNVLKSL